MISLLEYTRTVILLHMLATLQGFPSGSLRPTQKVGFLLSISFSLSRVWLIQRHLYITRNGIMAGESFLLFGLVTANSTSGLGARKLFPN